MKSSTAITVIIVIVIIIIAGVFAVSSYRGDANPTPTITESPAPTNTVTPSPVVVGTSTATTTATSTPNQLVSVALNQALSIPTINLTLTPLAIVEDSRCPIGVQCIQAGTVRLRTKVMSTATTTGEIIFTLSTPVRIGSSTVELAAVAPTTSAGSSIVPANYRFTFQVR